MLALLLVGLSSGVFALGYAFPLDLVARQTPSGPASTGAPLFITSVYPGGVSDQSRRLETTLPLPCLDGCWPYSETYGYYFGNYQIPPVEISNVRPPNDALRVEFCNQTTFDQLRACLNCVVANGNERPLGYTNNASATAEPPRPGSAAARVPYNLNGLMDADQANGLMSNVTGFCSANARALQGENSVTAVPTTTGPYSTPWAAGETASRPTWTGLSQYPAPVITLARNPNPTSRTGGASSAPPSNTAATPAQSSQAAAGRQSELQHQTTLIWLSVSTFAVFLCAAWA